MADVVAVMARLDGDAGGLQKASQVAERAYDQMVDSIEQGSDKAASSAKDMASKSETSFADMAKKGAGAFAAVAAGAGLLGSAFEAVNIKGTIAAQFDGTPEEVGAISQATQAAYTAGWGESMEDVSKTATGLQQTLKAVGQGGDITALTEQAQALSQTFEVDTTGSIQAVRSMLSSGLAPDAQTAFDVITKGMQSGANSSDDLLDTLTEYSSQFTKLGIDGPGAIGLINQGLAAGARNGDLVADAIKEFSIRAVDGSKTTAAGFAAIGLDADKMTEKIAAGGPAAQEGLGQVLDGLRDIKDPATQAQTAVELFGTQAEDLGKSLYALDPSAAVKAMGDVGGAADKMAQNSMGVEQQLQGLGRTLMTSLGQALAPIVPVIQDVITQIGPVLGSIGELVGPIISAVAPLFAGLVTAIAPVVSAIGRALGPVIATLSKSFGDLAPALGPVGSALASVASAAGPLLAAILPLVGSALPPMIDLITTLAPIVTTLATTLSTGLGPALDAVSEVAGLLTPFIAQLGGVLADVVVTAVNAVVGILPVLIDLFNLVLGVIMPLLPPIFQLAGAFLPVVAIIGQLIGAFLPPLVSLLMLLLKPILALIQPIAGLLAGAITILVGVISTVISWIGNFVGKLGNMGGVVASVGKAAGAVFTWLYNNAIRPATAGISSVISGLVNFFSSAFGSIGATLRGIGSAFGSVFGGIGSTVSSAFSGVVSTIRGSINGVISLANRAIGALNGVSVSIPDWVPGVGGQSFGISLPKIPMLAKGGTALSAGLAIVGERGPEVVSLPRGASVTPAHESAQALADMGGSGRTVNFHNTFNVQNVDEQAVVERWQQTTNWQLEQEGAMQP
jgi:phage-related protein